MRVRVAPLIAEAYMDLLGAQSVSSATLLLPPLESSTSMTFQGLDFSEEERDLEKPIIGHQRYRRNWNRRTLPIFSTIGYSLPSVTIDVPKTLRIERQGRKPRFMPQVRIGPWRNRTIARRLGKYNITAPDYKLAMTLSPYTTAEPNRPRRDNKIFSSNMYNAALSFVNRTYGTIDEFLEFQQAITQNYGNPEATALALAINEGTDYTYGMRGRLLKSVYQSGYWPFPVGFDTFRRIYE